MLAYAESVALLKREMKLFAIFCSVGLLTSNFKPKTEAIVGWFDFSAPSDFSCVVLFSLPLVLVFGAHAIDDLPRSGDLKR